MLKSCIFLLFLVGSERIQCIQSCQTKEEEEAFVFDKKIKFSPMKMGLLTNPSTSPRKGAIVKKLIKYNRLICSLLYITGVIWFCCLSHADLNNGTYFSENALLPGLVYSEIKSDSGNQARTFFDELKREREVYTSSMPYSWILAKMKQIGLETHSHNFTLNYPFGGKTVFTGRNVYGILRAPRASSTEAFVITVPYRNPESVHPDITAGVPLILAFADFARKQKYWAKDIIFLVTEQEQLGIHAWLEAYHGYDETGILDSGKLNGRAGSIQAAINLEIHNFDVEFIDLKIEGLNGQLPNLDLVNLVQRLSTKENIPSGHKQTSTRRRSGLKSKVEENFKHMVSMVLTQASGVPTGNHGLFHKYGIESVTIEAHKKTSRPGAGVQSLLRIIEGISRSLNNLLERFHQSFFFYVLVASDRFVSIGDYMPCIGLMAGSLLIKAFIVWLTITQKDKQNKNNDQEENIEKYFGYISVGLIVMAAHSLGFFISYIPSYSVINDFWSNRNIPTEMALFYLFAAISFATVVTPRLFTLEYLSTEMLHIFALVECGTCLIAVSMVNFSLGFLLCFGTVPFAILLKPRNPEIFDGKSWMRLFTRLMGLMLHPFSIIYLIITILTKTSFPELTLNQLLKRALAATMDAITYSVVDSMIYGNWLFKLVTVVLLPIWILFWNVVYPRKLKVDKLKTN